MGRILAFQIMARHSFFRTMATLTRRLQAIQYTPEGAVTISIAEEAFGSHPKSLGIVIIRDLPPSYVSQREKLLKLAYNFAKLDDSTREKYTDPASSYSFGWSHGKALTTDVPMITTNANIPDVLKGSYYANPIVETPTVPKEEQDAHPEYYGRNICMLSNHLPYYKPSDGGVIGPHREQEGIEGFEDAFKDLGRFIFQVGCELAAACQPFGAPARLFSHDYAYLLTSRGLALTHLSDTSMSLPKLISTSQTTKARLLHYFPPAPGAVVPTDDEPVDSWCGFHLDHSLLTGLCSAMYLQEGGDPEPIVIPSPSPASGLYIRTRGGDLTKVTIPSDSLAFQTGEALEIATGGRLRATPHCVRVGASADAEKISRETFALFMQPNTDQRLSDSQTFGQFSKKVFQEHYDEST
ncbi:hypothetical protein DXG01_004247 [Tephrocybe rancida]|nr:hypothetical protein DXG01_004247 [Tephrocybe rancida]